MSDSHDKILEAFLCEMLDEQRPSQAPEEIVRNVQARIASQAAETSDQAAPHETARVLPTRVIQPAAIGQPDSPPSPTSGLSSRSVSWIAVLALAAGVLLTTGAVVWYMLPAGNDDPPAVADNQPWTMPESRPADDRRPRAPVDQQPNVLPRVPDNSRLAERDDIPADQTALVLPPQFERKVALTIDPQSPHEFSDRVDQLLEEGWERDGLKPAEPLDLANWATRLTTRILGRTPSAAEKTELNGLIVAGRPADQIRHDIVDWLMNRPDFDPQFASHWGQTLAWKMLGLGPSLQTTDPDLLRTRDFLTDELTSNESLDEVVYELISVVGSTDPEREDFDPAASYLIGLNKRFRERELASAHIADTFLGQSLRCAQCHDADIGGGNQVLADHEQSDFYEFHSFFAQLRFERVGDNRFYVVNRNFLPQGQQGLVEAPYKYTDVEGVEHAEFPEWQNLKPGSNGFVAIVDRRSLLAAELVASPEFRQAMVDHVWTALLNVPLSGIDDTPDTTAPEQLLIRQELATQWAANGFRLPWLVRTIVLTRAFAVGVGSEEQLAASNPFLGVPPRFNHFYQRLENRRSAAGSLAIVSGAYQKRDPAEAQSAGLLARIDGRAIEAPAPRVIQAFLPTNENQWATSPAVTRQLDFIADDDMSAEQKIQHLVQAAFGRRASPEELQHGQQILESASDERTALQDIWWSLLNSVEYQLPLDVH